MSTLTAQRTPTAAAATPADSTKPGPWWRSAHNLLIVVAAVHALSPLLVLGSHYWFGTDETIYLSQLNAHVPASLFSAPRARGATFIAAPVTLLTTSTAAVRLWVAAMSGAAMYLGFRPWLRVLPGYVVPLAALLLSSVWSVLFYGFEVMPNEFVAFLGLAGCGCFYRWLRWRYPRDLVGVLVTLALIALLRPSDAAFTAIGLVIGSLAVRAAWRARLIGAAVLFGGLALGAADWVVEAETRYGGLRTRIRVAQGEQGGGGLHFAGAAQARALAGPLLCRDGCHAHAAFIFQAWWLVALGLIGVAVFLARSRGGPGLYLLTLSAGAVMAAQYVFTVSYAAPRFLIPTYAFLSLPCAAGAVHLVNLATTRKSRSALTAALIALGCGHVFLQVQVLTTQIKPAGQTFQREVLQDAAVLERGLHHPCFVQGVPGDNEEFAYATGCTNLRLKPKALAAQVKSGAEVIWLTNGKPTAVPGVTWHRVRLPSKRAGAPKYAFFSSRTTS